VSQVNNVYEDVQLIHKGTTPDPDQEYLSVAIVDNGKGIPPDILHNIFEEMVSDQVDSNWDGTGLGLPICLKLSNAAFSFIKYGSILSVKTVFLFYFPFQSNKGEIID
jgi:nitrogen-specific signal transduction histidine kinase